MGEGRLIALDASTHRGSVAVGGPDGARAEASLSVAGGMSAGLLPVLDAVLGWSGLDRDEVEGIVVGAGPGSFTGLRVAAATAKALARSFDVPLHAYSSLLATAAAHADWPGLVVPMFDARREEVFWAAYTFSVDEVTPVAGPAVGRVADVAPLLPEADRALFVGPGAIRYRDVLGAGSSSGRIAAHGEGPRARALLWLTGIDAPGGVVEQPARWEPDYLRDSGAERIKREGARG